MAKDIVIRGNVYGGTPAVEIPTNDNDVATFVETSDATLTSGAQMLDNVTAYADGTKITGSIETKTGSDLTVSGATVTVPSGYYASQATKSISNGTVTAPASVTGTSATVSTGTNIITLSKSVSITPNVTTSGYISSGTAGNSSVSLTASVTTKGSATITPTTTNQTISSGTYLTGTQTISGDSNLKSENIVAGKTIFNIAGSAQIPVVSQDSVTKIVSIS